MTTDIRKILREAAFYGRKTTARRLPDALDAATDTLAQFDDAAHEIAEWLGAFEAGVGPGGTTAPAPIGDLTPADWIDDWDSGCTPAERARLLAWMAADDPRDGQAIQTWCLPVPPIVHVILDQDDLRIWLRGLSADDGDPASVESHHGGGLIPEDLTPYRELLARLRGPAAALTSDRGVTWLDGRTRWSERLTQCLIDESGAVCTVADLHTLEDAGR